MPKNPLASKGPPEPEGHWIFAALKREWPALKKFFIHLACFTAGAIFILFLYEKFLIPGKDSTIISLQQEKDKLNNDLQREDRENDKLVKQVDNLRIYRAQDAMPLKKKALILAQQIQNFTKDWKDTDSPNVQADNVQKYLQRFGLRASIMREDLDQNGQQSDALDKVMYNFSSNYQDVRAIASEVERLAKNLSE